MNSDSTGGSASTRLRTSCGMPNRGQQADEGAPGVADEVGGRGVQHPQEGGQVVHVREHLVVGVRLDVLIGPGVAAAVRDRAVGGADRRELLLPAAQIVGAAMDEDDGLALALLAVRKRGPVDGGGPDPLERARRCPRRRASCRSASGGSFVFRSAADETLGARRRRRAIGSSPYATSPCSIANSVAAARVDTPILR